MTIRLEDLVLDVERTRENEAGEIEILDEDVLRCLGERISKNVVQAFLVEWEDEWFVVAWWEAGETDWELLSNQAVFPVDVT